MSATEWLIAVLAVIGGLFSIVAAIGLIRLPDVYSRLHATGKSSVTAVVFLMGASFIYFAYSHGWAVWKLLLVIIFVALTTPVAALMIARSAYRTRVPLDKRTHHDDLESYYDSLAREAQRKQAAHSPQQGKSRADKRGTADAENRSGRTPQTNR
ncbi:monovalent cation/H(+) antiporter subunit G [Paenibacillus daejeonensis]|uniref:monovalent cation/H(+) antiporter subunit G n=1 Tax=Paenibacillus daejeonensis TaxID=135193 RepID=UPI00037A1CDA|nr:monovalent cation/H(+) antiporter subunit G [Paenibacillus daejeonensis]